MAFTASKVTQYPLSQHRTVVMQVTHTGVTTSTLTKDHHGLSNIISCTFNNETTEGDGLVQINVDVSGAALGSVYTTGVTAGDVVTYVIVGN